MPGLAGQHGAAGVVPCWRVIGVIVLGALLSTSSLAMGCPRSAGSLVEVIWK